MTMSKGCSAGDSIAAAKACQEQKKHLSTKYLTRVNVAVSSSAYHCEGLRFGKLLNALCQAHNKPFSPATAGMGSVSTTQKNFAFENAGRWIARRANSFVLLADLTFIVLLSSVKRF